MDWDRLARDAGLDAVGGDGGGQMVAVTGDIWKPVKSADVTEVTSTGDMATVVVKFWTADEWAAFGSDPQFVLCLRVPDEIEIMEALGKEILWCEQHPDPAFHREYRKGFINGLIQARYIIAEIRKAQMQAQEAGT